MRAITADTRMVTTTADRPFCIDAPRIGFLNLQGPAGEALARADREVLSPLFAECRDSDKDVPACHVLFIYCDVGADGRIVGRREGIRDLVRSAGASIAVVASASLPEHYLKSVGARGSWPANIVLTIDRRGDKFGAFFAELFRAMFAGKSMLMAWVKLAPQIPGYDHPETPGTLMLAEAGHLVFAGGPRAVHAPPN